MKVMFGCGCLPTKACDRHTLSGFEFFWIVLIESGDFNIRQ